MWYSGQISLQKERVLKTKLEMSLKEFKQSGKVKAKELLEIHNFTGADWGGTFGGVTKQTWINAYLELTDDDMINTFQQLGHLICLQKIFNTTNCLSK